MSELPTIHSGRLNERFALKSTVEIRVAGIADTCRRYGRQSGPIGSR